jgi:hypothetical protein
VQPLLRYRPTMPCVTGATLPGGCALAVIGSAKGAAAALVLQMRTRRPVTPTRRWR